MFTCEWSETLKYTTEMLISSIRSFRDVSLKSFPSSSYSPEKKDSASIEYSLAMSVMELILKAFQQGHSQFLFLSFLQQKSLKFSFSIHLTPNKCSTSHIIGFLLQEFIWQITLVDLANKVSKREKTNQQTKSRLVKICLN